MIKYILNSGGLSNNQSKAKVFFSEVVKGLSSTPKILLCFFAQPREDWEEKYADDLRELPLLFPNNIQPIFDLAFPETFVKQVQVSDAVYIHGGDDHLLQYWLKQFSLPSIWQGKVIATNSASSSALSEFFWTCDWRKCMQGLGILPIKFLPHFKSNYGMTDPRGPIDWEKSYDELENYGAKDLPIYAPLEGDFQVLTVS